MKSLNKINDVFGVDTEVSLPNVTPLPIDYNPSALDQEDDFQLARQTLRGVLAKSEDVITELIHISKNSEHPRAFEVAGQLIKAQSEVAKELMGLHRQKKDIEKVTQKTINQQNNILFAGSTADLMKLINGDKNKIINAG
jgi:hypothetical protein